MGERKGLEMNKMDLVLKMHKSSLITFILTLMNKVWKKITIYAMQMDWKWIEKMVGQN